MDGYRVEDKEPWLTSGRKRTLVELFCASVLLIAFMQMMSMEKAVLSAGAVWIMYSLITVMKAYRREVWFWVTIALFASAHIAAIILLPAFQLPKGPALSYVVPAMFADGFTMLGILKLLASRLSPADQS